MAIPTVESFNSWSRRFLRCFDACPLDLTKSPDENETMARDWSRRQIHASPREGAIYGHMYHLLAPVDPRIKADSSLVERYVDDPSANPRVLLMALAVDKIAQAGGLWQLNQNLIVCTDGSEDSWDKAIVTLNHLSDDNMVLIMLAVTVNDVIKEDVLSDVNVWIRKHPAMMNCLFPAGVPAGLSDSEMRLFLAESLKEKIMGLPLSDRVLCYREIERIKQSPISERGDFVHDFSEKNPLLLMLGFILAGSAQSDTFRAAARSEGWEEKINAPDLRYRLYHLADYVEDKMQKGQILLRPFSSAGSVAGAGAGAGVVSAVSSREVPAGSFNLEEIIKKRGGSKWDCLSAIISSQPDIIYKDIAGHGRTIDVATQRLKLEYCTQEIEAIVYGNAKDPSKWAHCIIPGLYIGSVHSGKSVGERFDRNIHVTRTPSQAPNPALCKMYPVDDPIGSGSFDPNEYVRVLSGSEYNPSDPSTWFKDAFKEIRAAIMRGDRLLINCTVGESRSVTLVAAFLMYELKMPMEKVLAYIQSKRLTAEPTPILFAKLEEYSAYTSHRT